MENTNFKNFIPSRKEIEECQKKWNGEKYEQYVEADAALKRVFDTTGEHYLDDSDILIKCATINSYYGTRIYGLYDVAKQYIQKRKILAKGLKEGDVNLIAELTRENGKYSFATKFCHFSNPDAFPIYDYYVDKMLRELRKRDNFCRFQNNDLRDYPKFVEIINALRKHYGLEGASYRQIDIMLWISGKIFFNKASKEENK